MTVEDEHTLKIEKTGVWVLIDFFFPDAMGPLLVQTRQTAHN
jgi:hypothetical protein